MASRGEHPGGDGVWQRPVPAAFRNSIILTVASVSLVVVLSAIVAFVLQRRRDRMGDGRHRDPARGARLPPALVPTIFVLQRLGLYKTLLGLTLVEVAFS